MPEIERLILIGPTAGQLVQLDDATAATATADGWARDISRMPFESSDVRHSVPMWEWPESLISWLRLSWFNSEPRPPDPDPKPFTANVENISSASMVKVSSADFPNFPAGAVVWFSGTGNETLDAEGATSNVISVNQVGKTFKIDTEMSEITASITTGTVSTQAEAPLQGEPLF